MTGYLGNIESISLSNNFFRQVLYTGQHSQLVVMRLQPLEDIGEEIHDIVDQFIRIEEGLGRVVINGEEHNVKDGDAFIIPAGTKHNVFNLSPDKPLRLYTIYSPPHHKDLVIHKTKSEAENDKDDHL